MTPIQRSVLWYYSGMPLPEDYQLNLDNIPRARAWLERRKFIEPHFQFPYFIATRKGLTALEDGE